MVSVFRGGDWGDIFIARNNGLGLVYCEGNFVRVETVDRLGQTREKKATFFPEPLLFVRGETNPLGEILVMGKGHQSGKFYIQGIGRAAKDPFLEAYGTHSCDVIWTGDAFRYVVQTSRTEYYDSADEKLHQVPVPNTSQGIIQLLPSGPQWSDLLRESVSGMFFPFEMPNLFIGEGRTDPPHIHCLDVFNHLNLYKGTADRPRGATNGNLLGIATRDARGTFFLILERPFENVDLGTPTPTIPPAPKPEPEPLPELTMNEPALSLWHQFTAKFPNPGNTDESARAFSIKFAEQCRFSLGPNWGTKSADPNRPVSKDTVTERVNGRMTSYDLMLGVGTGNPQFNNDPPAIDTTGQHFIEVAPHDYLGTSVPVPTDPTPPVPEPGPAVIRIHINNVQELANALAEALTKFS